MNGPTRKTRNEIRDQIWAHFLGCERKLLSRPQADNASDHIINGGPASKVFGTAELLEGILKHASTVDVVTASGTNKMFHNVMTTSPCLQPKLFLCPTKSTATLDLTYRHFEGHSSYRSTIAELNPLLRLKDIKPEPLLSRLRTNRLCETVVFTDRIVRAGCWTNMYLTNPPCTDIVVHLKYTCYSPCGFTVLYKGLRIRDATMSFRIHRVKGTTFAMLIEAVYLKRGLKYNHGPGHRCFYSEFSGLHRGSPVPTAASEALDWLKMNDDAERRVLDLSETYIDLFGIVLPSTEDLEQMELIREEEGDKQTDSNVTEENHSENRNAITRFALTIEEV